MKKICHNLNKGDIWIIWEEVYELNKSDSDSDVLTDTNDEESENSVSEDELYDNLEPESNLKDPEEEMEINTNETIDFIIDKLK